MDDHVRQRGAVVAQQIREQRVGKPSKRAEGHRWADVGVVAVAFEACRFVLGVPFRKVPLVRDPSDDREPPRIRLELQLIRRRHHVHDLIGVDVRQRTVAVADTQVQGVAREGAYGQNQFELLTCGRVEVAASQHRLDGLPAPENLGFLVPGTQDVAGRARRKEAAGQHAKREMQNVEWEVELQGFFAPAFHAFRFRRAVFTRLTSRRPAPQEARAPARAPGRAFAARAGAHRARQARATPGVCPFRGSRRDASR